MKNKILILILALIGFVVGVYIFSGKPKQKSEITPVSFSHYVHTKLHKIKCVSCHQGVNSQMRAGIPNIEICSMCHSTIINPSSEKEKQVYNYVKDNKLIPWRNYYTVPDYVYFSHRRHVKIGKLDCIVCHGDMTGQTSPELINFKPFKMQVCFNCHEEKKVTTDCGNCHH